MGLQVEWLRLFIVGVRIDGIEVEQMSSQLERPNKSIRRIGELSGHSTKLVSQIIVHAVCDCRLHPVPGSLVKRAAPNKNDWAGIARVLGGIAQGKHSAPGVPHNCQRGVSAEVGSELVQISDVASDR
jgi:hypothetical protein